MKSLMFLSLLLFPSPALPYRPRLIFTQCELLRQNCLHLIQNLITFTTGKVIEEAWEELLSDIHKVC